MQAEYPFALGACKVMVAAHIFAPLKRDHKTPQILKIHTSR